MEKIVSVLIHGSYRLCNATISVMSPESARETRV
jgi:hypothetical protein